MFVRWRLIIRAGSGLGMQVCDAALGFLFGGGGGMGVLGGRGRGRRVIRYGETIYCSLDFEVSAGKKEHFYPRRHFTIRDHR